MGTYSEAKAAVRGHLETNWATTKIAYPNEVPADPWPPVDGDGWPAPWVYFEMVTMPGQAIRGAGKPGSQISQTNGFVYAHVLVPSNSGDALATEYAEIIGELFRTKVLYDPGDGCALRTWTPRVDEGGDAGVASEIAGVNVGTWHRVTMSVPFQYWHRG